MDKQNAVFLLEACLLAYDGVNLEDLILKYKIPEDLAKRGFNLYLLLKSK